MSKLGARSAAILAALGLIIAVVTYGLLIEAQAVQVTNVSIRDNAFGVLKGKTIVHVTDLHTGKLGSSEKRVLQIIKDLKPDLVLLTGDYVKWGYGYESAVDFLAQIDSHAFAVLGDYDYSCSRKSCLFCHEEGSGKPTKRHNVRFLRNEIEMVRFPEGNFWVAGVIEEDGGQSRMKETLGRWKEIGPAIILSHSPLNFDLLSDDQDVLMLSGDTHGGQIPLPSWLWRLLGYEKNAKYSEGLFERGRKKLFVSRGIGTSHIPFRFMRKPEVVVFHFEGEG